MQFTRQSVRKRAAVANLWFGVLFGSQGSGRRGFKEIKSIYPLWTALPLGRLDQPFQKSLSLISACSHTHLKSIASVKFVLGSVGTDFVYCLSNLFCFLIAMGKEKIKPWQWRNKGYKQRPMSSSERKMGRISMTSPLVKLLAILTREWYYKNLCLNVSSWLCASSQTHLLGFCLSFYCRFLSPPLHGLQALWRKDLCLIMFL